MCSILRPDRDSALFDKAESVSIRSKRIRWAHVQSKKGLLYACAGD